MSPIALLDGARRWSLACLAFCSVGQAIGAVVLALAFDSTLQNGISAATLGWMVLGGSLTAGAMFGERWAGEVLAQSLVSELRMRLFDKMIASRGAQNEAQWLNPMVGDLAAIRNWAARGPVRLAAAALSLICTLALFATQMPHLALSGLPLLLAVLPFVPIAQQLTEIIRKQRIVRGGMTRFIVRRARMEANDEVAGNRHGRKSMAKRSAEMTQLAIKRARHVGSLEAVAAGGSALAAIALSALAINASIEPASVAAAATLIGFSGARLLEVARASHASISGNIAFLRIRAVLLDNTSPTAAATCKNNRDEIYD